MADSPNAREPIDLPDSDSVHSDDEVSDSHQTESKKKTSNVTSLNKPGIHFKRQRKLTSDVWGHFEFLDKPDEQEELENSDNFMHKMAARMNEKFAKYWTNFSIIMAVAVVLDPRFKYEFVEWAFKKVYGEIEGTNELVKFKERLDNLYGAYVTEASTTTPRTRRRSSRQPNEEQVDVASDSFMMDFDNFSSSKSYVAAKSDLQMYLEEPLIPRATNINILYHWKTNVVRYPILSKMARDILAIPISTVTSESAFSTGGRVLDCYRSSLKPNTAEAIICLKDWTFGEANMDPQLQDLCGKIMAMKVNDDVGDTPSPSPPQSAPESPAVMESQT